MVVWIPMLDGDELPAAREASAQLAARDVPQYWDGAQLLGKQVAHSVGAPDWTAWDIYLFYPPGARWTDQGPPPPAAVLAQVAGVVVAAPGTLPAVGDPARLPEALRGKAIVAGEQRDLTTLLARVADAQAH
jgi:hypothetical protein